MPRIHQPRPRLAHPWANVGFSLAALLLASCGGGNGSGTTAAPLREQPTAAGSSSSCMQRVNNTTDKLLECMTLNGVMLHLRKFQEIADANGGIRTSGTPGYDASADYAEQVFRNAGYLVTRQEFTFQTFISLSPSVLEIVSPPHGNIEHNIMAYSGSGEATAPLSLPSGLATGCNAADFASFPSGHIALIRRGTCTFALKAANAASAGAAGVIVYNNIPGPLNGTLGSTFSLNLPVVSVTQAIGEDLVAMMATGPVVTRLKTHTFRGQAQTSNVIAESTGGDPDNVVMIGAHLDSVDEGPGINDNGSGAAAILETAMQMAKVKPRNKVRFALWGAEESGLVGSAHYVSQLTQAERDRIALYLNFDMIGSPNHVFFIYDGDDSDGVGAGPGPGGSDVIERDFETFYRERGLPFKGTDFSGRSDYGPFIAVGIPSGGLFTGAEGIKTVEEASIWGGTAGQAYDSCYHAACDTIDNLNPLALDVNSDAVAYSTLRYAMNTEAVNGKRGKGNFKAPPLQGHEPPPEAH